MYLIFTCSPRIPMCHSFQVRVKLIWKLDSATLETCEMISILYNDEFTFPSVISYMPLLSRYGCTDIKMKFGNPETYETTTMLLFIKNLNSRPS